MANRYWVGGTASWDGTAGTKWSTTSGGGGGSAIPTSADDVFLDAASGASTVTIASGNTGCKSLTCTGFTGTLTGSATLSIAGSFTLSAGMTCSATGQWSITAAATLTSAGKTLPPISSNSGGVVVVNQNDAFTFTSTPASNSFCLTINSGTYNTNNYNITLPSSGANGGGISVNNANTRALNLGSSTISITLSQNNNIPFFDATVTTGLTFNAGTSTISCISPYTGILSATSGFVGGGLTFYSVTLSTATTFRYGIPISGANTFTNLSFTGRTTAGVSSYSFAANQTVTGTLTCSAGTNATMRTFLTSSTLGTTRTITAAAVSLTDVDFQDITIAGAAAPASGTRLGDCKGNSGITFSAGVNKYWNLAGSNNWQAVAWALSAGGGVAVNNFPLAQDTAIFTNSSPNTGAQINFSIYYNIPALDMSARTNSMILAISSDITCYGNWTNGSGTAISGTSSITFSGRTSQSITSAGKTFTSPIGIDSPSGTLTLQDALTISRAGAGALTLTNGTLDLNGFTLTLSAAASATFLTATGTKNLTFNAGTLVIAASGTTAFNNAVPTGFTTTAGTGTGVISLTSASAKTFVGGGSTYNCTLQNSGAGALTVSGSNTFTTIANSVQPTTFTFTSGTTQTVTNFNVSGTAGNLVTIGASTTSAATLSKASGTVNSSYLSLSYSTATGGATWNALNSTDGGNNSGWIFAAPSNGNFLLML
jgi:hypothetical protein